MKSAALAVAMLFFVASARRAEAAPVLLSLIPESSEALDPATGTVRFADLRFVGDPVVNAWWITALDRPICFVEYNHYVLGRREPGTTEPFVVERLSIGDPPFLERTRVDASSPGVLVRLGAARIPLVKVAQDRDVSAYAYRTGKVVRIIVPRGFSSTFDAFQSRVGFRNCGFMSFDVGVSGSASDALWVAGGLGAEQRWAEDADSENKPSAHPTLFLINASLSTVTRDPEPILSVTIRVQDPS